MPSNALWRREFAETILDIGDSRSISSYLQSAERLQFVIRTGLLAVDDIRNDPEKFFEAHRMLASQVARIGSTFWIRFNIQYNLFAGTMVALGTNQQIQAFIQRNEERPRLGCFAITEAHNSGSCSSSQQQQQQQESSKLGDLMIETTATLSVDGRSFVLHTPHKYAAKTMVSQGMVADEIIVMATMMVHGHSYGPQAFLVRLRDQFGRVLPGMTIEDMGPTATAVADPTGRNGEELDHARISFQKVKLPLGAHLSRYLQVQNDATVRHPYGYKIRTMDVIAQRLFTGRIAVAQAALSYTRALLENSYQGGDRGVIVTAWGALSAKNQCWTPFSRQRVRISNATAGTISSSLQKVHALEQFLAKVEFELCQCLLRDASPSGALQQTIAVAKVEAVETCLELCLQLQRDMGWDIDTVGRKHHRHGRMVASADPVHFLHCLKYADGDSAVIMEKIARDLARAAANPSASKKHKGQLVLAGSVKEALNELKEEMMHVQADTGCQPSEAWEECWELVHNVAKAHMDSVLKSYGCSVPVSPVGERW